jgi:hypothetical protein
MTAVQFKEQGGKVQVLLYSGYDELTHTPRIKKVGSFDKYTYKPSPGLMDKLNATQRDELQAEFERRRQLALGLNRQHYLKSLVPTLQAWQWTLSTPDAFGTRWKNSARHCAMQGIRNRLKAAPPILTSRHCCARINAGPALICIK